MALAALCSQIQHNHSSHIFGSQNTESRHSQLGSFHQVAFKAFVVDHGVRNGSFDEAHAVADVLAARGFSRHLSHGSGKLILLLGIETKVLQIDWAPFEKPAELPNFESLARKYRYQVLGNACRAGGINSLFLAHHEDDQVETVMIRLIGGHKRLGLMGMKAVSEIPECYGIHGVHESGGRPNSSLVQNQEAHRRGKHTSYKTTQNRVATNRQAKPQLYLESGGIRVYRPLLNFNKGRLIATCQDQETEWFEDQTNNDPTLTLRNAIRHMYNSHTLPSALSKPAILKMLHKCQDTANTQLRVVESCLSRCIIKAFDTRAGTLRIVFNNMNDSALPSATDKKLIAANLLRRVTMLVTPREHVPLPTLHDALKNIFPEVFSSAEPISKPVGFTAGGLYFQPLATHETTPSFSSKCEWLISRQPYDSIAALPLITFPPLKGSSWSNWTLYDGRYWIRIQNLSEKPVFVRPFRHTDYDEFRHLFAPHTRSSLHESLKKVAPGNIRFTLPSIVRREDWKDTVIALPTLNARAPEYKGLLSWEVRYKKVDLAGLSIPNQDFEGVEATAS